MSLVGCLSSGSFLNSPLINPALFLDRQLCPQMDNTGLFYDFTTSPEAEVIGLSSACFLCHPLSTASKSLNVSKQLLHMWICVYKHDVLHLYYLFKTRRRLSMD